MGEFQRPRTAQAAVLAELRARILSGALAPGAPLRQEELAEDLGVSRVPVREALRILEAEGHVVYAAHRGYRVRALTLADLVEIYHLRGILEDALAREALADPPEARLAGIESAFAALADAEAAASADPARLAAANRAFHWAILDPSPRADRVLTTLWDASDAYRARWFADQANVARGAADHAAIMAAIRSGDAGRAVALLAAHRAAAVDALRARLP
jgi:DNA-binding GntR family transcriptional regulator